MEKVDFEVNDLRVLVEKHTKQSAKFGTTTFYKVFFDYDWMFDIGTLEITIQTIALKADSTEDEIKELLKGL